MATTGNITKSYEAAGISKATAARIMADSRFHAAVFRYRQAQLSSEGGGLAYAVLREIMTERTILADGSPGPYVAPVQERRQAAVAVLRLAGHTEALGAALAQAATATALADLSEEQLREHVRTAEAALAALRATAPAASSPDVLDVAPDQPEVSSLL